MFCINWKNCISLTLNNSLIKQGLELVQRDTPLTSQGHRENLIVDPLVHFYFLYLLIRISLPHSLCHSQYAKNIHFYIASYFSIVCRNDISHPLHSTSLASNCIKPHFHPLQANYKKWFSLTISDCSFSLFQPQKTTFNYESFQNYPNAIIYSGNHSFLSLTYWKSHPPHVSFRCY